MLGLHLCLQNSSVCIASLLWRVAVGYHELQGDHFFHSEWQKGDVRQVGAGFLLYPGNSAVGKEKQFWRTLSMVLLIAAPPTLFHGH